MSAAIVKAVILLATSLGMHVIAEGVETKTELALLRDLSCAYAQGYYWSRPVDAETVAQLAVQILPVRTASLPPPRTSAAPHSRTSLRPSRQPLKLSASGARA